MGQVTHQAELIPVSVAERDYAPTGKDANPHQAELIPVSVAGRDYAPTGKDANPSQAVPRYTPTWIEAL